MKRYLKEDARGNVRNYTTLPLIILAILVLISILTLASHGGININSGNTSINQSIHHHGAYRGITGHPSHLDNLYIEKEVCKVNSNYIPTLGNKARATRETSKIESNLELFRNLEPIIQDNYSSTDSRAIQGGDDILDNILLEVTNNNLLVAIQDNLGALNEITEERNYLIVGQGSNRGEPTAVSEVNTLTLALIVGIVLLSTKKGAVS